MGIMVVNGNDLLRSNKVIAAGIMKTIIDMLEDDPNVGGDKIAEVIARILDGVDELKRALLISLNRRN